MKKGMRYKMWSEKTGKFDVTGLEQRVHRG